MHHAGTFSARLPTAGNYRLRVRVGSAERSRDFAIADPAAEAPGASPSPTPSAEPCGDGSTPRAHWLPIPAKLTRLRRSR